MTVTLTLEDGTQIFTGHREPASKEALAMWAYREHCKRHGGAHPWRAPDIRADDTGWIIPLVTPGGLEHSGSVTVNVRLTIRP